MAARHVLVPLGVLALAAWLFLGRGCGREKVYDVPDDVAACALNLRVIYQGLLEEARRTGRPPAGVGVAFLAAPLASGALADTRENRASLTCPGPGAQRVRDGVDYRALDTLGGADSAYAGRDTLRFPLAKFPSGGSELEPLVACDNAAGLNHAGCMNVLYSDGSVATLTLAREIELQHVPSGATTLVVGPRATVPDLRKLSGD